MSDTSTNDKVQTGLRIPLKQYEELTGLSARMGVSLNALALVLIDIGLSVISLGTQEERRSLLRNLQDTF